MAEKKFSVLQKRNTHVRNSSQRFAQIALRNLWRTFTILVNRKLKCPPKYLPILLMFVTSDCNLRCRMCGVCDLERDRDESGELTTEQWKAVISDAATKLGTTLAVVSGGEPLLREDVFEIIRYATDCGISIHLCTNALLLSEEKILKLKNSGVKTVSFSVEGPEASTHESIRGPDSFPMVVNAIKQFRKIAPEVRIGINFVITRINYKNMVSMVEFAHGLGVQQLKFAPIHTNLLHRRKNKDEYEDLLFKEEDISLLEQEVQRLKKVLKGYPNLITTCDEFFDGISSLYKMPKRIPCYAGYAICAISPMGFVSPCSDMDSEFNVNSMSIDKIWLSPEFHKLRQCVDACSSACWDTAYTELSLWLRPSSMIKHLWRNLRDVRFYFE